MTRRSTDWHISGWLAVALAPIAFPVALLIQLLPLKKTRDREPDEVAGFIRDFLDDTGGEWDWDDFTSIPITDPSLEAIRTEAGMVQLPLDLAGHTKLEDLLLRAKALANARPTNSK